MSIFYKKTRPEIPPEFCGLEVKCKSSACTGEKTIGFYDRRSDKLLYAELVRSREDIEGFCRRYGIDPNSVKAP